MNLLFFGTPDFASSSLERLVRSRHTVVGVVTQPDRPKGRGRKLAPSPVKSVAQKHGLAVFQPEKASAPEFVKTLRAVGPDLAVVVAYGEILKRAILDLPKHGAVNLHASLLPKYRGGSPIQAAILNGDTLTGVTTIQMDEGMDTGNILLQEEVAITEDDTAGTLHDKLAEVGARLLIETVDQLEAGTITPKPQNHELATYTRLIKKEDGVIDWNQTSGQVHNFVRAMNPWPLAHTRDGKYRIWMTSAPSKHKVGAQAGTVVQADDTGLVIAALDGTIRIERLQAAGGKLMSAPEFLRGHTIRIGEKL